ncbi:MAG: glutamate racemase [Prevotellaceae bacterium]|nr:glutamate racemase [Prevotellaceae bacterium]
MRSSAPIGLFDSGVGGLSVWREVVKLLPHEHTAYYADSAYCPYGQKQPGEIIERSSHIMDFLIGQQQCKLIVVACNTATAAAIDYLRATYPLPFVGMEPAVKPAALHSVTGVVGVLATQGTFKGRLYHETLERFAGHIQILEQPGDGLVELVESGHAGSKEAQRLLEKYIRPMLRANIDHLVLGCTHYPFLIPAIRKITGDRITILNPAPAVAQRVKFLLSQNNLLNASGDEARHEFFSSGDLKTLRQLLQQLG